MGFYTENIQKGRDWQGLERVLARLMSHLGWKSVEAVGGAGDRGADVIGIRVHGGEKKAWVVQSKAVTGGRYIPSEAIDQALNALSFYDAQVAAVATNGDFYEVAKKRQEELKANGYTVILWNGNFIQTLLSNAKEFSKNRRILRPYQEETVRCVIDAFDKRAKRAFYIVATGLGKTVIAAEIAQKLWERGCRRILVLCHAVDLAPQLEQGFWSQLSKEIPTSLFYDGCPPRASEGISFGLYQSLYTYLSGIKPGQFDVVIVDEAHHAMAPNFRECLSRLAPRFLLGMTATPWRGDGACLAELFGSPLKKVSLVDGMAMGYLARVEYRILCDNVDWDGLSLLSKKSMTIKDLNTRLFLPQRDDAVLTEIQRAVKDIPHPRIAVFSPSIEHCERFSSMLNGAGIPSCVLTGQTEKAERRRRLLAFARGSYKAICAVNVMNEGIDIPEVNLLVFLRATHSRRIFVQQLGRGLRLAADKEKVLVLDFVSDIRRMADMAVMNREGQAKGKDKEVLYLRNGFVSFSDARVEAFVNAWLKDVADLGDTDENVKLSFPEV